MFWENSRMVSTLVQASGWSFKLVSTSWATRCYKRRQTENFLISGYIGKIHLTHEIFIHDDISQRCTESYPADWSGSTAERSSLTWEPMSWYMELTTLSNRLMSSFWLKSSSCLAGWSANIVISAGIELLSGEGIIHINNRTADTQGTRRQGKALRTETLDISVT